MNKKYLFSLFTSIFLFALLVIGCKSKSEIDKVQPITSSSLNIQQSWNDHERNMFKVYVSMRKIDSLSAALNLRFTKNNARGL